MTHGWRCLSWAGIAAILGVAIQAHGQDPSAGLAMGDPLVDAMLELVRGGGLPAVLAYLAWWARGALGSGVPLVVQLHPDSLAELRRLRRALEREADDSEGSDPPTRAP